MEILYGLADNGDLVRNIKESQIPLEEVVPVEISLPEYLDITSLMALYKRMVDVSKVTGRRLRLLAKTKNTAVEKYATRLFADRDDIFLTVDWR